MTICAPQLASQPSIAAFPAPNQALMDPMSAAVGGLFAVELFWRVAAGAAAIGADIAAAAGQAADFDDLLALQERGARDLHRLVAEAFEDGVRGLG